MAGRDFGGETQERTGTGVFLQPGEGKLVLLVLAPGGIREFHLPEQAEMRIGRAGSAEIRVEDGSVSREHAVLSIGPDGLSLVDRGSRNGTAVNGEALKPGERRPLQLTDQIRIGKVSAQLHLTRTQREVARQVSPEELDARVAIEAERCTRYERSLAVLALEALPGGKDAPGDLEARAHAALIGALRMLDVIAARGARRFDVLLAECDKEQALDVASRLLETFEQAGVPTRIGVAAFPGDAPTPATLLMAAQLAMNEIQRGVGNARKAARIVQLGTREVVIAEPAMVRLFALIERAAPAPMPVLVHGETGSGKEIVAEALHALGPRAKKPLVKLNCAAVPENLLESELFGHERGAFSGAVTAKPGFFVEADGGTLFLDEIGELQLPLQAKLLRVIEDGLVRPIGATRDKRVDVRIVAATHRDLRASVQARSFREDLYYRLNALVLTVPPLRERKREIRLLAERFAAEAARGAAKPLVTLGEAVIEALESYAWPGNLRELRNVMARAVVVAVGPVVALSDLPPEIAAGAADDDFLSPDADENTDVRALPLETQLRELEKKRILEALAACAGNQTRAAEMLQMPRRTFVSKLGQLGIERPRKR